MIAISGRRRIGKSTLVQHYAKDFKHFIEIQGLAPVLNKSPQTRRTQQLLHFSLMISKTFKSAHVLFNDWEDAFRYLAEKIEKKPVLIFLDEVSWMSDGDELWPSKLKNAWDLQFKKNLMLFNCRSGTHCVVF